VYQINKIKYKYFSNNFLLEYKIYDVLKFANLTLIIKNCSIVMKESVIAIKIIDWNY